MAASASKLLMLVSTLCDKPSAALGMTLRVFSRNHLRRVVLSAEMETAQRAVRRKGHTESVSSRVWSVARTERMRGPRNTRCLCGSSDFQDQGYFGL